MFFTLILPLTRSPVRRKWDPRGPITAPRVVVTKKYLVPFVGYLIYIFSTQPPESVEIRTASPPYTPSRLDAANSEVYKPHRRMVLTQKFDGNKFGFHCSTDIKLIFRLWQASFPDKGKLFLEIISFFKAGSVWGAPRTWGPIRQTHVGQSRWRCVGRFIRCPVILWET